MQRAARIFTLIVLTALVFTPAEAGVRYTAVTSATEQGEAQAMGDITVEAWVDGDQAKVAFVASANPVAPTGSYLLTTDAGRTVYLVDPQAKTYTAWDMSALMTMAVGLMEATGGLVNLQFTDPKVERLGTAPGEEMVGLPTTRHTYRTSYGMEMSVIGMKRQAEIVTDHTVWSTQALDEPALGMWLRREPPKTGNQQFDTIIANAMGEIAGFPLQVESVMTTKNYKGKKRQFVDSTTSTSRMKVTELERTDIPADTFTIPADYTEEKMEPPAEDAASEQEETPNPMKQLKGLFGGGGR